MSRRKRDYRFAERVEAYRFFREHAGWLVGFSAVGAVALARAEQAARERGWACYWEWDEAPADPEFPVGCVLRDDHGRVLGSLWGIEDNAPPWYRRVIEAELALDAGAPARFPCSAPPSLCA